MSESWKPPWKTLTCLQRKKVCEDCMEVFYAGITETPRFFLSCLQQKIFLTIEEKTLTCLQQRKLYEDFMEAFMSAPWKLHKKLSIVYNKNNLKLPKKIKSCLQQEESQTFKKLLVVYNNFFKTTRRKL